MNQKRHELAALRAVKAGRQVDLDEVLRAVLDDVSTRLEADRGTLYLLDHARGELVSRVAHLPELPEIRLRVGEGIAGWVAVHGVAVMIPGASADPRFTERIDLATGYQTKSLLAVPVNDAGGQRIGVLQVLNKTRGVFSEADRDRLTDIAVEVSHLLEETSLRSQLRPGQRQSLEFRFNGIVGESPVMREVYDRTARAAATEATVLIQGESGSGKELIARAVHFNSPRREGPFVKVDCASLPESLIENELFGHERGAFTGADRAVDGKVQAAHGGTLFLDELGELPLAVQAKLLRLLQDRVCVRVGGTQARAVDVRFVGATHRDLEGDVAAGRFRQDLYYRLRVVPILVPPLRSRGAVDLDRLIDHLLFELARRHARPELRLSSAARAALHRHTWPGNVRELENCIEAAVVLTPTPTISAERLGLAQRVSDPSGSERPPDVSAGQAAAPSGQATAPAGQAVQPFTTEILPLRLVERRYLQHVLRLCDGNRSEAARRLGIGRNTLLRKLSDDGEA